MNDSIYAGKLRVRVSGLLIEDRKLLLARLRSPISNKDIWTPPGGGVEFGEPIQKALKREFEEETSLSIKVGKLTHINELIEDHFHAIEFFFLVEMIGGDLKLGVDPEHDSEFQILKELEFVSLSEIKNRDVKPDFLKRDFLKNDRLTTSLKDGE
ncbi:MAG: hypothetical protein BalsKO_02860 [Balneolaceae bacterium]